MIFSNDKINLNDLNSMISLSHIINPVSSSENEELFQAQQVTFGSMLKAKKYSADENEIELCVINRSGEKDFVPDGFKVLAPMLRDIRDVVKTTKPYPFLNDIILKHAQSTSADYLVYSNLDIAVMPFFYETISAYIEQGHDALVINRRRVHNKFAAEKNLNVLFAEHGGVHTGYDCFVIKKTLITKFIFKDICLGVPAVGNDLFYNIFAFAEKPVLLTDKHLTFHIGLELYKNWGDEITRNHNAKQFQQLMQELLPLAKVDNFPGADLNIFKRHFKWLMNPTFDYATMFRLDARRGFKKTEKKKNNSFVADRKQKYLEQLVKYINFD